MVYDPDDTIAAIGTAAGGAPRGMVRLSGPQVLDCLSACFMADDPTVELVDYRSPTVVAGSAGLFSSKNDRLPCELFLWPTSRSYTRQPTAELHTLGSRPLLEALLQAVCDQGARLAEPGEFTLRAFLAGRLDLTQAEAVLGVIDAQSSAGLSTALAQLAGGLSQPLAELREQLLQLLAELEAGLDFVEEDIEFISAEQLTTQLNSAQEIVAAVISQLSSRGDSNDLPRVVLSGPPNAGKSSLFNALVEKYRASREETAALVSDQTGTTRDFVTAVVAFEGVVCALVDTAGIESESAPNSIDHKSQAMTGEQQAQASLILRCEDASNSNSENTAEQLNEISVHTKIDLLAGKLSTPKAQVACSSVRGDGLEELAQLVYERLHESATESEGSVRLTAARCAESLRGAEASLSQALGLVTLGGGEELIAAEVRAALHALGQVVGTVYTDDILDRIFGQFCIGK